MSLSIVILAAGQGKRMHSRLPKVLHTIGNKPMLAHVIETAQALKPKNIYVIYGHDGEQVRSALAHYKVQWIEQKKQLGTGHAVLQALPKIPVDHRVLVLLGDVPLVTTETLKNLLAQTKKNEIGFVTTRTCNPKGFGRVLRDEKNVVIGVVEDKDATEEQKKINEVNTGIITAHGHLLHQWLPKLSNNNSQSEYYLPEIFTKAIAEKIAIKTVAPATYASEVNGVNDRVQLGFLERYYQEYVVAYKLALSGVTFKDYRRFDMRGEVDISPDVTIDINVILEGKVKIGTGSVIGPNCLLRDAVIGENVVIKANTVIEEATIASDCVIGPFARVRPGTKLKEKVHIGNFVEIKNSKIAQASKVNHLSYIGDATVGEQVNIGAGTITCNYDGVNKHPTKIGNRVQVGSDTTLVAPVTIHDDVYIAAATTVRKNVSAGSLVFNPRTEETRKNWTAQKRAKQKTKS